MGRAPVLVERSASPEGGYAIGLYPLGSCVLHGLGTYERLRERALVLDRYELASESGQVLQAFDMSVDILKTRPNDVRALSAIVGYVYTFNPPSPADLDTAEKAAQHIITNLDTIYAPANKLPNLDDAAWVRQSRSCQPRDIEDRDGKRCEEDRYLFHSSE